MIRKLFKETSQYFWGEALIMASGVISFPILTRIFSQSEYGLLSLIAVTIGICSKLSSLGANRSLIRFFHHYQKKEELDVFLCTNLYAMVGFGLFFSIISVSVSQVLLPGEDIFNDFNALFPLALVWMLFQNVIAFLHAPFRLIDKIVVYNVIGIVRKYSSMLMAVGFVLLFDNLFAFYYAQIISEGIVLLILFVWLSKKIGGFLKKPSRIVFFQSLRYGFPLAISGIASLFFNSGDRYLIAHMLGKEQVAIYSVGYTFCDYIKELLITSVNLSLIPLIFKSFENNQFDKARDTLCKVIKYYSFIALPLIFLFVLIPKELIIIVASDKYSESAKIMPIVMAGVLVGGLLFPFSAGFHLKKDTVSILLITFSMAVLNIVLNCFMIPIYGLKGAALSTLISGASLIGLSYMISKRSFFIHIPFRDIFIYIFSSIVAFAVSKYVFDSYVIENNAMALLVKSMSFVSVYITLVLYCDMEIRSSFVKALQFLTVGFNSSK